MAKLLRGRATVSGDATQVELDLKANLASPAFTGTPTGIVRGSLEADIIDGTKIADDAIDSEHYANGSIDTAHISADAIDGTKIADNALNSEHYSSGSIDGAHLAEGTITADYIATGAIEEAHIGNGEVATAKIAADAIDGTKLADNAVDSEHYTDGSIDTAHIGNSQVTTAKIADDAVTLAKMASGTDGQIITWDASGNPTAVGPGSDGEVLTSTGAGSPPAFESASGPAGSVLQVRTLHSSTRVNTTHGTWEEPSTSYRVAITPAASANKIVLNYFIPTNQDSASGVICLYRAFRIIDGGSTDYDLDSAGTTGGDRFGIAGGSMRPTGEDAQDGQMRNWIVVDFPNTALEVVYGFETKCSSTNSTDFGRSINTSSNWGWDADICITAMEVKV